MELMKEMDPVVVKSLREIVEKDMKWEIEMMQNQLECTEKCKLMQKIGKESVDRSALIVTQMINFKWCDICSNTLGPQSGSKHC